MAQAIGSRATQLYAEAYNSGREFIGVFSGSQDFVTDLIERKSNEEARLDAMLLAMEARVGAVDSEHEAITSLCKRALALRHDGTEDSKLRLKQTVEIVYSRPGRPFAGLGLTEVEVTTLNEALLF